MAATRTQIYTTHDHKVRRVFVRHTEDGYEIDFRRGHQPWAFMHWKKISHRRLCKVSMYLTVKNWKPTDTVFAPEGMVVYYEPPK